MSAIIIYNNCIVNILSLYYSVLVNRLGINARCPSRDITFVNSVIRYHGGALFSPARPIFQLHVRIEFADNLSNSGTATVVI